MEVKVSTIDWLSVNAPRQNVKDFVRGLKIVADGEELDLSSMIIGERIQVVGEKEGMYYKNVYRRTK